MGTAAGRPNGSAVAMAPQGMDRRGPAAVDNVNGLIVADRRRDFEAEAARHRLLVEGECGSNRQSAAVARVLTVMGWIAPGAVPRPRRVVGRHAGERCG